MRKIAEALRLRPAGLTTRKIAASLNVGQSTISEYLERAERAGLSWPLPEAIDEVALERQRFAPVGAEPVVGWRSRTGRRSIRRFGARGSRFR